MGAKEKQLFLWASLLQCDAYMQGGIVQATSHTLNESRLHL